MNEKEAPIEKYVRVYDEAQDNEECKCNMVESMLKDEMLTLAERNGIEVSSASTKDEIAEKLVKPEIYEDIVEKKEERPSVKRETEERKRSDEPQEEPEPIGMNFLSSISEIFSGPSVTGYRKTSELWLDGIQSTQENLKRVTDDQLDKWKKIENEWTERALDFQEQIDVVRKNSSLPAEETKELSVIWRNFYNKMAARMTRLGEQTREVQESLKEITEEYADRAEETLSEGTDPRDFGKLFGLWSDFSEDMRKEMKDSIEDYVADYEEFVETWDKFSKKTDDLLEDLQEEQEAQVEELYERWNSNFDQIEGYVREDYQKYKDSYESFLKQIEEQNTRLTEIAFEMAEEMEENYSNILEGYIETVNRGYENLFTMPGLSAYRTRKENDVKDLKERVKRLEEKMEED